MSCVKMLSKDVNKYCNQLEDEDNKMLFIKTNAIHRSVIDKKKIIAELDNALEIFETENKILK